MDGNKQMAAELPLSHYSQLVVVCIGGNIGDIYRIGNSKLPGGKSSDRQPCEIVTNRITK